MKTQRYKLLTTLIVSALHPNEPQAAGTVWAPVNVIDVQEAEALVTASYAEKTDDDKAPLASTVLERQDAARKRKEAEDRGETVEDSKPPAPVVSEDDQVLSLILEGTVDQVKAELEGLTAEQLTRLGELEAEKGEKARKGVADAVAEALEELEAE